MSVSRKCWCKSFGSYGSRVRVAERKPGGTLYLLWVDRDGRHMKRSLGHSDRKRGQAAAMEAASRLANSREVYSGARLTIRTLVDNYYARGLAGRSPDHCSEVRRKLERWVRMLGPDRL